MSASTGRAEIHASLLHQNEIGGSNATCPDVLVQWPSCGCEMG